jgi:hypothetical protein
LPFVTRRMRCGQMQGRRPGKTGGVFAGIHRGFFRAENDADVRGSFAPVERSRSDRLLDRTNDVLSTLQNSHFLLSQSILCGLVPISLCLTLTTASESFGPVLSPAKNKRCQGSAGTVSIEGPVLGGQLYGEVPYVSQRAELWRIYATDHKKSPSRNDHLEGRH